MSIETYFHEVVNNSGYMEVRGGLSFVGSIFNNIGSAYLLLLGENFSRFSGVLNNSATIESSGDLYINTKKFTNSGMVKVDGSTTFDIGDVENSGTINANNGLTSAGKFENNAGGLVTVSGAKASFAELINRATLDVSYATKITSYTGDSNSELVLNLPSSNPGSTTPLLTVDYATFFVGAKINLVAPSQISYLINNTQRITILNATKKLTITGLPSEILFSRV